MVGHIDVRAIDPGRPASVSRKVITGLLRRDLGFRGLVVTDSLGDGRRREAVPRRPRRGRRPPRRRRRGADARRRPRSPGPRSSAPSATAELQRARLEAAATRMLADADPPQRRRLHPGRPGHPAAPLDPPLEGRPHLVSPVRARDDWSATASASSGPTSRPVGSAPPHAGPGCTLGSGTKVVLVPRGGAAVRGRVVVALDTPYVLRRSVARVKIADVRRQLRGDAQPRRPAARPHHRPPASCRSPCAASPAPAAPRTGWTSRPCRRRRPGSARCVASSSPVSASRLRSCSGTTSTPRFLMVSVPMPRSRRAASQRLLAVGQLLEHLVAAGERRPVRRVGGHVGDVLVEQPALDAGGHRGDQAGPDHRAVRLVEEAADVTHRPLGAAGRPPRSAWPARRRRSRWRGGGWWRASPTTARPP